MELQRVPKVRPRAVEPHLHGGLGEAKRNARLRSREPLEIAHHEHRAIRAPQRADRLVHRADQPRSVDHRVRIGLVRRDHIDVFDAFAQRASFAGERAKQPCAGVPHDAEQPREHARVASDVWTTPQLREGLLNRVVGVDAVATYPQTEAVDAIVVAPDQERKSRVVAASGAHDIARVATHLATPSV